MKCVFISSYPTSKSGHLVQKLLALCFLISRRSDSTLRCCLTRSGNKGSPVRASNLNQSIQCSLFMVPSLSRAISPTCSLWYHLCLTFDPLANDVYGSICQPITRGAYVVPYGQVGKKSKLGQDPDNKLGQAFWALCEQLVTDSEKVKS